MELINKLYRNFYYFSFLRKLEKQNGDKINIGKKSSIAIFSSPRGGSTWLAELMKSAIDHSTLILEPLYRGDYQTSGVMPIEHKAGIPTNKLGYWYYQPILDNEIWPESKEFFKKLLNHELLSLSVIYENKISDIPHSNCFIYKFCYGHLLMPWLFNNFDFSGIFLIRHPGAVIASQLNFYNWRHIRDNEEYKFILPKFRNSEFFNQYNDILSQVSTPEENLAAIWAITNSYVINHQFNNVRWKTISYEELYLDSKSTLEDLFSYLEIPFKNDVLLSVKKPSKTTSSNFSENSDQLSSWRKHLTLEQISRIDKILSLFKIDFYTMDNDLPNLDRIKPSSKHLHL